MVLCRKIKKTSRMRIKKRTKLKIKSQNNAHHSQKMEKDKSWVRCLFTRMMEMKKRKNYALKNFFVEKRRRQKMVKWLILSVQKFLK